MRPLDTRRCVALSGVTERSSTPFHLGQQSVAEPKPSLDPHERSTAPGSRDDEFAGIVLTRSDQRWRATLRTFNTKKKGASGSERLFIMVVFLSDSMRLTTCRQCP